MEVRPVAWSDFPSFLAFYYSRYDEVQTNPELFLYTHPTRPTEGDEALWFGRLMKGVSDGDTVCRVADDGGRVVGVATVEPRGNHLEDRHAGIYANAVVPDRRGQGIGRQLMTATLRACRGRFDVLYLTVVSENARAIAFYRKHGFEECGRFPRGFRRGGRDLDDLVMWCPVPPPGTAARARSDRLPRRNVRSP